MNAIAGPSRLGIPAIRAAQLAPTITTALPTRSHSTAAAAHAGSLASEAYTNPERVAASTATGTPHLDPEHRSVLSSLLRVDHSGEIAANTIYAAQAKVFHSIRRDAESTRLTLEMWESEKKHLKVAEMLLRQHRVRPSALNPLWGFMGSALGGVTALMGKEAAMACTEAVETVIGEHYDDQISHLDQVLASFRSGVAAGEEAQKQTITESGTAAAAAAAAAATSTSPIQSLETLKKLLEEFRDDELEHLDTAVEHDAQQAPAHALLSAVIQLGCKGAIEVAKRI